MDGFSLQGTSVVAFSGEGKARHGTVAELLFATAVSWQVVAAGSTTA